MVGKPLFALLLCFASTLLAIHSYGAVIHSVSAGNWSNPSSFDCSCIPGGSDDVIIDNAIILDQSVIVLSLTISGTGQLDLLSGIEISIRTSLTGASSGTGQISGNGDIRFSGGGTALVSGNLSLENSGVKITEKQLHFLSDTILFLNSDLEISGTHDIENHSAAGVTFGPGSRIFSSSPDPVWYQRSGSRLISTNPENIIAGTLTLEAGNDPNTFETFLVNQPDTHLIPQGKFWDLIFREDNSLLRLTGEIIVMNSLQFDPLDITLDVGNNHTIRIEGDWLNQSTASDPFLQQEGLVIFEGDSIQQISSIPVDTFHQLEIFQAGVQAVEFSNSIYIQNLLILTMGHLKSSTNGAYVAIMDTGNVAGGSPISYVMAHGSDHSNGNFMRKYFQNPETMNYPIGNVNHYHPFTFTLHNFTTSGQSYCDIRVSSSETGHPFRPPGPSFSNLYWMMDVGGMTDLVYDVGMGYESQFAGDENQMVLGRWDGLAWSTYNMANTVFDLLYSNHRITELPQGHDFAGIYGLSLPIELISFEGEPEDQGIRLTWLTASESNNDHFEIHHSLAGSAFELMGMVQAAGTSSEVIEYSFLDENPAEGLHYYALKQVDYDGSIHEFGIIEIAISQSQITSLKILSNPVRPGSNVRAVFHSPGEGSSIIRLIDITGKTAWESQINHHRGSNQLELNGTAGNLGAGIYFLIAETEGTRISEKVMITR